MPLFQHASHLISVYQDAVSTGGTYTPPEFSFVPLTVPVSSRASRNRRDKRRSAILVAPDLEATKIRSWRLQLQKGFLAQDGPKPENMPEMDSLFSTIEGYENMTIPYLTFSKVGKVMRHIHALAPERIPREEEFHFRERAQALIERWQDISTANAVNAPVAGAESKESAVTTGSAPISEDHHAPIIQTE